MKYTSTLIAVKNIKKSKQFYHDVLGLRIIDDFGANVTLDGGVVLQTIDSWQDFIGDKNITLPNNASEVYFEETHMDSFLEHLNKFDITYVHAPLEHSWGQRVVRFYDLDCHIIEVGEDIVMVVKRFVDSGMTMEQVAVRMDVPLTYVQKCLKT